MSANSSIEWCESTWNPLRGVNARHTCARISPGCDNCYAATMTRRGLGGTAAIDYGKGEQPNDPSRLDEKVLRQPSRWMKPRTIFVCSMTDLFGSWVPDEWIARIYSEMFISGLLNGHTFQVLTKRPSRMADWVQRQTSLPGGIGVLKWSDVWPLKNVWAGTSIESDAYIWRANKLRETPAAVRWISAEPLLSGLPSLNLTGIDWLVAGGESGPGARPMHPDWPRDLRDCCVAAGTAFFFKQWGEWAPAAVRPGGDLGGDMRRGHTVQLRSHGEPDGHFRRGDVHLSRIGKKSAGRLLDGRTWDQYPPTAAGAASTTTEALHATD